jgi:hypothetical protein
MVINDISLDGGQSHHHNPNKSVGDIRNDSIISDAIFPELIRRQTLQSLSNAARAIHGSDSIMQKNQYMARYLGVELAELPLCRRV